MATNSEAVAKVVPISVVGIEVFVGIEECFPW
jgi:hypothetical protein